jgi:hypothetical protein
VLSTSFDPLLEQTFSIPETQVLTREDTEALLGGCGLPVM